MTTRTKKAPQLNADFEAWLKNMRTLYATPGADPATVRVFRQGSAPVRLFTRSGHEVTGIVHAGTYCERLRAATYPDRRVCSRCGGMGGSDKWKHTGWTCYACGGSGGVHFVPVACYTAERLAELNAAADVRAAKRAAVAAEKAAVALAARIAAFEEEWGGTPERQALRADMRAYAQRDRFVDELCKRVEEEYRVLTDAQEQAVRKAIARRKEQDECAANSRHVGEVGKRMRNVTVTTVFEKVIGGGDYYGDPLRYMVKLLTADQCELTYFGSSPGNLPAVGESGTVDFTVKKHEEYRGTAQTIIQRPAASKEKVAA